MARSKYSVIEYKIMNRVTPEVVVEALERLLEKHNVRYRNCLFKVSSSITEFEFDGTFHTNRNKNAVLSICKRYPVITPFYKHIRNIDADNHMWEDDVISNFSEKDYSCTGMVDYAVVREIISKIPRPYSPQELELVFDEISYGDIVSVTNSIRSPDSGFGPRIGNYIYFSRSVYGNEKFTTLIFAGDDVTLPRLRELFWEFAESVPGKYMGTEIQFTDT